VFVPSRRGGRRNIDKGIQKRKVKEEGGDQAKTEWAPDYGDGARPSDDYEKIDDGEESQMEEDKAQENRGLLASTSIRNACDALDLLSRASETMSQRDNMTENPVMGSTNGVGAMPSGLESVRGFRTSALQRLGLFSLVREGIVTIENLRRLVTSYFGRNHIYVPIIVRQKIPDNDEKLATFAEQEPLLLTAIVVVASRFELPDVHEAAWRYMQNDIMKLTFGTAKATVGDVEALLLLAENAPRSSDGNGSSHREELRMTWNMIGLAIRIGYYLGLDQQTLLSPSDVCDAQTNRERLAWTFCYMHDRHASIRVGKAFWSRGPGLCFQNPDVNESYDSRVNFPSLVPDEAMDQDRTLSSSIDSTTSVQSWPGLDWNRVKNEDYALLVQAYAELTQILTNIHDTLYPNRDRTIALVQVGGYYRMLDEFTRTFAAFELDWKTKRWGIFPLNETVWVTFHYAKLYAYSFAFQAHIHRATMKDPIDQRGDPKDSNRRRSPTWNVSMPEKIFPRGLAGSPDAKFIFESINSAIELLKICIDDLYPGGVLAFLPTRYYGFFSYAAVSLIKAVFSGAVTSRERRRIFTLVKRVIWCFSQVTRSLSPTTCRHHPAEILARQLRTLVKTLMSAEPTSLAPSPERELHESGTTVIPEAAATLASHEKQLDGVFRMSDVDYLHNPSDNLFTADLPSGSEGSVAGFEDLEALLSAGIDNAMWLSYFI
jgi:hypothetical protein